ncbi:MULTISPECIES: DNA-processing protein DprA [Actinomycetes]|jgi:DNA processing protein|uniref:DNA protecting protein DprA n=2 Tax=Actinomycetes TaxID=1760 RepID=A0A087DTV0_9BIFI|nr:MULTISPECIES: DNA-processing protein DprA [Actinomycetes]KFI98950.1 DNA protecting protein DprA [Bifidobacterium subtile]MCH3974128.1 DNA-protecting protein DprA [Bifidobacterium tibiigranuli]QOL37016.1 DNA-processing protein DprA [Bifidobacterium subtile]SER69436.1 DNA processing protein [Propionibacterium cyclohexanicum]
MDAVADQVRDERAARIILSMIAEPADPATGGTLREHGGIETLRLAQSDSPIPDMDAMRTRVWRERLAPKLTPDVLARVDGYRQGGMAALIPGDQHWPTALADLGDRAPYVLWAKGAASLLSGSLSDRVTITGSRAATHYGEHVAGELATCLANAERVIIGGGAYGIEAAAHRGALTAGGQTVAVLAGGIDRRYPAGNAELLDRIGDVGLLVSERPPQSAPTRQMFLARHRLMAASLAVKPTGHAALLYEYMFTCTIVFMATMVVRCHHCKVDDNKMRTNMTNGCERS